MADNLAYIGNSWERRDGQPLFQGARQIGLRDIDPSLLSTETHYDSWAQWGKTWWVPFNPTLRPIAPTERLAWLESNSDIVNDASLIEVSNPRTGRRWLTLWGFSDWKGLGLHGGRTELQRDTWFRLLCIVTRTKDEAALIEELREKTLTDPDDFATIDLHGDFYLGEYPWHPSLEGVDSWSSRGAGWQPLVGPDATDGGELYLRARRLRLLGRQRRKGANPRAMARRSYGTSYDQWTLPGLCRWIGT